MAIDLRKYPGCTQCEEPEPIDAIILYPSLGTPMVLAPAQSKCSLILATGADGLAAFEVDAQANGLARKGSLYVDRHLRLSGIDDCKPLDTDTTLGLLYRDGQDCANGKKHIKVWHLGHPAPGELIRDHHGVYQSAGKYRPDGRPFATLAPALSALYPDLRELWEVELDLAPLYKQIGNDAFMNWSWLVETTARHRRNNPGNFFLRSIASHHEPQDRHIDNFLRRQAEDTEHHHYPHGRLYERDVQYPGRRQDMAPIRQDPKTRLQSWHPVIRAAALPLKLAHVSDVHVNVRHHALARSPAKLIEEADAGEWNRAVGERLCHSYFAFKQLIDTAGAGKRPDTALLVTGDLLDFNRNIDPIAVPTDIGGQWKAFNVLSRAEDRDLYKRGMDDILVYSLVRYAYAQHKLPVFMSTGNHEAYAMPYGISPRSEVGSWSFELGLIEETGLGNADKKRQEVEAASKWAEGKPNEGIAADHNLTVYEATLAFGPTYGQVWTSANFHPENFDWFHALFTPFTDCCLPLGAESDSKPGAGCKQVLSLIGWGQDERFKSLSNYVKGNPALGLDMRGEGFLPYATQSLSADQLTLLDQGQAYKRANAGVPWSVGSHFTVFNYTPDTPLATPSAGYTTYDAPERDAANRKLNDAQFNRYNFGGCELRLKSYFERYVNQGRTGIDHHFSGHSHRAAVFESTVGAAHRKMVAAPASVLGAKVVSAVTVQVARARDPDLDLAKAPGTPLLIHAGTTAFIVSACGGPIGVQNLNGELLGWTLRPPSGTLLDGNAIRPFKTLRQAPAKGLNEKPRLCVALDYMHVMNQAEGKEGAQPLLLFDPVDGGRSTRSRLRGILTRFNDTLPDYVAVRESAEVARLDCIADIAVWVFEGGTKDRTSTETPGQWKRLEGLQWDRKNRKADTLGARFSRLLLDEQARDTLARLMVYAKSEAAARGIDRSLSGKRVPQALCEVRLQDPKKPWSADMDCTDPWVFPLVIGMVYQTVGRSVPYPVFLFKRPDGEKGEVPDWDFLARNFAHKGYIDAQEAITGKKKPERS